MELRNESDLEFTDISSENWRAYIFPRGERIFISGPHWLNVSDSGSHRILDVAGVSHYIPAGWLHLEWVARDGAPHFVR